MIRDTSFSIIAAFLLVLLHVNLPGPISANTTFLPILWVVFIIIFSDRHIGAEVAIAAGFFLDIFSSQPFGVHLLTFPLIALAVEGTSRHVLTNRSLYATLALGLGATLSYRLLSWGMAFLFTTTQNIPFNATDWFNPWQFLVHAAFLLVGFYAILVFRTVVQRYFVLK